VMTLLILHGASRDETDLASFAGQIAPDAHVIAPRGTFPDGSGYTFFRRRSDRSIDSAEVVTLAEEWLGRNAETLLPASGEVVIVGYSSGAIFAVALMSVMPGRFSGAVLLRPEPLAKEFTFRDMPGMPVIILAGRHDERRQSDDAARLAAQLGSAGAKVKLHTLDTGHGWATQDEDAVLVRSWFAGVGGG
jgi:phospholipase/carboxylesterase